jgi:hypothetical protein
MAIDAISAVVEERAEPMSFAMMFYAREVASRGMVLHSPLFELALVLVRFDHVACLIVNADHRVM